MRRQSIAALRDREQPCAHRAPVATVRPGGRPEAKEDVLAHLFGRFGVGEHLVQDPEHDPSVPVVQLSERIGVPPDHLLEQGVVISSGRGVSLERNDCHVGGT